jgi:hypothetical protein
MAEYEPGVCNIGARERRKRRNFGLASLIGGAAYVIAVIAVDWPDVALLASFLFALGAAVGLMQARASFCAGLAMAERYDMTGDDGGDAARIHDAAAVRKDRMRAGRLAAEALLLALLATVLVYFMGTLV